MVVAVGSTLDLELDYLFFQAWVLVVVLVVLMVVVLVLVVAVVLDALLAC